MPYRWVNAPVLFKYKNVRIYGVYKDDFIDQGLRTYWYGLTPDCSDDSPENTFDVRDLPVPPGLDARNPRHHRKIIGAAIDAGLLRNPEP